MPNHIPNVPRHFIITPHLFAIIPHFAPYFQFSSTFYIIPAFSNRELEAAECPAALYTLCLYSPETTSSEHPGNILRFWGMYGYSTPRTLATKRACKSHKTLTYLANHKSWNVENMRKCFFHGLTVRDKHFIDLAKTPRAFGPCG